MTIRGRLLIYSITVILVTTIASSIGAAMLNFYQTRRQNDERIRHALESFQKDFKENLYQVESQFGLFTKDAERTNRFIIARQFDPWNEEIPLSLAKLTQDLAGEQSAFYWMKNGKFQLAYYYLQKLGGPVIVDWDDSNIHTLLTVAPNTGFASQTEITKQEVFPLKYSPVHFTHGTYIDQQRLMLMSHLKYINVNFDDVTLGVQQGEQIGIFVLEKPLISQLKEMDRRMGVNFAVYDGQGHMGDGEISMQDLKLQRVEDNASQALQIIFDQQGNSYDALIAPLMHQHTIVGYVSASIAQQKTFQKIWESILLLSTISLVVLIGTIIPSLILVRRFSAPIVQLTELCEQINLDNLKEIKVEFDETDQHELKVLSKAFYSMIQKLQHSHEQLLEKERLENELKTAHTVQEFLIPKSDPQLEGIEIASFYQAASETGGDWYDYRYHSELQTLEVLIGDVTGHGMPAALITAMVDSFYESIYEQYVYAQKFTQEEFHLLHPTYFMDMANKMLCKTTGGQYHMTLYHSVLDLKMKRMVYSNASHTPCLIWRPSCFQLVRQGKPVQRDLLQLNMKGVALGHDYHSEYKIDMIDLQKGDVIVWYTDGLIENRNEENEEFGLRRFKRLMKKSERLSAEQIKDRIIETAYQFYGKKPPEDDVTLIVGKVK